MSENGGITNILSQTVILSFDLVVDETENLPKRVASALQSQEMVNVIQKAFEDEAKKLMSPNATKEDQDPMGITSRIAGKALSTAKSGVLRQLKESKEAKDLEGNIEQLKEEFVKTPFGIWIDENKKILYIVGAVAAFGTAATMYYFKTGDSVAKLAEGKGTTIKKGSFTIKGTLTKFEPSTGSVGLTGKGEYGSLGFALEGRVNDSGDVQIGGKLALLQF